MPGWHATIDGRPAHLVRTDGVMWSLAVPPGHHTIRLWYLPKRLVEGVVAAAVGAAGLAGYGLYCALRRRRRGHGRKHAAGAAQGDGRLAAAAFLPDPFSLAPELSRRRRPPVALAPGGVAPGGVAPGGVAPGGSTPGAQAQEGTNGTSP